MRRAQWLRVGAIVLIWTVAGFLMAVYDDLVLRTLGAEVVGYSWLRAVSLKTLGTAVGAVIAGFLVVFVFKQRLRGRTFATAVTIQGLAFATIAIAMGWIVGQFAQVAWTPEVRGARLAAVAWQAAPLKAMLFGLLLGGLTSFGIEVQDRIGRGAFLDFIRGRYHRARTERRCFMFLDLVGSTPIAERLGHVRYYELLNTFFADVTDALLETRGEIYQYVGDEIVVSWPEAVGLRDANCVRCFLLIQDMVEAHRERYRSRFQLVPEFRAAFHVGEVTTGDVGVLKRDRVFTGDTLNAAARIEERCKVLGRDALVSGELADRLPSNDGFWLEEAEVVELRGREGATRIFAVERR